MREPGARWPRRSGATNITSMAETPHDERAARIRGYAITMGIRTACFLALIWVRGPWMLVFAAGAIFLPYFAVVLANAVRGRRGGEVERPSAVEVHDPATAGGRGGAGDEPPVRRFAYIPDDATWEAPAEGADPFDDRIPDPRGARRGAA